MDKQFVHHHQTSTKLVEKHDGGSSNKVETFGGPTMGGESNNKSTRMPKVYNKNEWRKCKFLNKFQQIFYYVRTYYNVRDVRRKSITVI